MRLDDTIVIGKVDFFAETQKDLHQLIEILLLELVDLFHCEVKKFSHFLHQLP